MFPFFFSIIKAKKNMNKKAQFFSLLFLIFLSVTKLGVVSGGQRLILITLVCFIVTGPKIVRC